MLTEIHSYTQIGLIGAGGHAKVVLDALRETGFSGEVLIFDQDPQKTGKPWLDDLKVHLFDNNWAELPQAVHICIGHNATRKRFLQEAQQAGKQAPVVSHPATVCSRYSKVEAGSLLCANSVVGPDATLGQGVILNHGACADHDCIVGDYCHIAPNAALSGGVRIGELCLIGAGANILPGQYVGADSNVGAGSVVNRDLPDHSCVIGVPARPLSRNSS